MTQYNRYQCGSDILTIQFDYTCTYSIYSIACVIYIYSLSVLGISSKCCLYQRRGHYYLGCHFHFSPYSHKLLDSIHSLEDREGNPGPS